MLEFTRSKGIEKVSKQTMKRNEGLGYLCAQTLASEHKKVIICGKDEHCIKITFVTECFKYKVVFTGSLGIDS